MGGGFCRRRNLWAVGTGTQQLLWLDFVVTWDGDTAQINDDISSMHVLIPPRPDVWTSHWASRGHFTATAPATFIRHCPKGGNVWRDGTVELSSSCPTDVGAAPLENRGLDVSTGNGTIINRSQFRQIFWPEGGRAFVATIRRQGCNNDRMDRKRFC